MISSLSNTRTRAGTLRCRILANATQCATAETIALRRRQPVIVDGQALSVSFLKHSEDQTVLALHATLQLRDQPAFEHMSLANWGVVAAPNFFGRCCMAQTIERYHQEGAWGVSPHVIPHSSLHALSGTISQALKIYGPNFGISGGPNACADAFLMAGALLAEGNLPGLLLILSGHEDELIPQPGGQYVHRPICRTLVLALSAAEVPQSGRFLSLGTLEPVENFLPLENFQWDTWLCEDRSSEEFLEGRWRLSTSHWVALETVGLKREVHA